MHSTMESSRPTTIGGIHPVIPLDPVVVFPATNPESIAAFFHENGYVVVDGVSTEANRQRTIDLMQQMNQRDEKDTRRLGFMDVYHDDVLAQLRQDPALVKVFASIYQSDDLWVVFDRLMYWHPTEGEMPLAAHVDQNPIVHPDFSFVQGMLALADMDECTGTLALVPKSPAFFQEYTPWVVRSGYVEYQGERPLDFVYLRLKAGQMVIWDSRTTHSRFRQTHATRERFAALLTFTPALRDREDLVETRKRYFEAGIGHVDIEAGMRATAHPRCERSLRMNPEVLTELGRKLYF